MADDQATQADKAQAPATFSSFINKSGSGKKFAPKAARRRPGPAPAAAQKPAAPGPAPAPAPGQAPAPAPSTAEPQTDPHPEPRTDPHTEPQTEPRTDPHTDPPTSQAPPQPSTTAHATAPAPPPLPTPAPTQTPATQAPTTDHAPPPNAPAPAVHESPSAQPTQHAPPPPTPQAKHHVQPGTRSRQGTPMMPVAVMLPSHDAQPLDTISHGSTPHSQDPVASTAPSAEGEAPAQQKRKRRSLPWTAVNHPQEEGGEATDLVEPPAKKKRAPPKPRAKKTTAAADTEEQHEDGAETAPPTQTRATARARGKRQAVAPELGQDGQPVEPPPNKSRRSAKDSPEGDTDDADTTATPKPKPKPKPKPRAPRRNKATPAPGEDGSVEPKRRGRPPREATPEDAEDHVIDPDAICMDDLASRNIRVGKLSRREREMRKIDWDAVKQRRREEDARHISTKESQAAVDKLLEMGQVEQPPTGPRYHVVDGRIELIQDSGTIDRERDADREIELMTITEEDDLTTRITARSFMKNNKRFPNEFVLPGQGRRWNAHSTDMFYQGLRSFGTDFQMIAHMFPGMTRRSIKTKFTREERENPDIVRECLRGKSELASHWTHFLAASQLEEESFADADKIKHELEEEEARMRTQINEALREKEERDKQRKLAGVTDDGPDGDKDAKGRKKRRLKDKNVTFQEDGVEVLGDVDDDPNWGC